MKRKSLLIILGIIIIINVIIMVIYKITPEQELRNVEYEISGGVGPYEGKTLQFQNVSVLKVLTGNMVISEVTSWMVDIFEENLKIFKDETLEMSDAQLGEFYDKNKIRVRQELHVDTKEDFVNLMLKARAITCDLEEYEVCSFSSETSEKIDFECSYSNGEKITGELRGRILRTAKLKF